MKILIVEDNPMFAALLRNGLAQTNIPLQIVGHATNIEDARNLIKEKKPDVLILDIDLGNETSFTLFEHIDYRDFEIIFATSYDKFAVAAFDVEAIGYLIKPVITSQLEKFLLIAQRNLVIKSQDFAFVNKLGKVQKHSISDKTISVPSEAGFDIVSIDKIQRCESINSTTHIFLADGKKLISSYNLGKFYDVLFDKGFYQVHRSNIINLTFVKKYLRSGSIIMQDGVEIPISKIHRQGFLAIFSAMRNESSFDEDLK